MPCLRKALLIRRQPQSPLPVWKSKSTKLETARTIVDGRTTGFCKLIADRSTGGILGCHVVGGRAVEIVQVVAIAMAGELRVDQLAQIPLSFPTFMPASSRERHTALLNRSTPSSAASGSMANEGLQRLFTWADMLLGRRPILLVYARLCLRRWCHRFASRGKTDQKKRLGSISSLAGSSQIASQDELFTSIVVCRAIPLLEVRHDWSVPPN